MVSHYTVLTKNPEEPPDGKIKNILLLSTDISLPAEEILEYYQARFQIELFFVMPNNLRVYPIVNLVVVNALVFILMPV